MTTRKRTARIVARCRYCGERVECFGDICPDCTTAEDDDR